MGDTHEKRLSQDSFSRGSRPAAFAADCLTSPKVSCSSKCVVVRIFAGPPIRDVQRATPRSRFPDAFRSVCLSGDEDFPTGPAFDEGPAGGTEVTPLRAESAQSCRRVDLITDAGDDRPSFTDRVCLGCPPSPRSRSDRQLRQRRTQRGVLPCLGAGDGATSASSSFPRKPESHFRQRNFHVLRRNWGNR